MAVIVIIIIPLLNLCRREEVTTNVKSDTVCVLMSPPGHLAVCRQAGGTLWHRAHQHQEDVPSESI